MLASLEHFAPLSHFPHILQVARPHPHISAFPSSLILQVK